MHVRAQDDGKSGATEAAKPSSQPAASDSPPLPNDPSSADQQPFGQSKVVIEIPRSQWCQCVRAILNVEGGNIAGCVKSGASEEKLKLFKSQAKERSRLTPVSALLSIAGCSESENENVGALSFDVQWREQPAGSILSQAVSTAQNPEKSVAPVTCEAGGIRTVEATLYLASAEKLASAVPWNCSNPVTTLNDIPASEHVRLVVIGRNAAGLVLYRGEQAGLTITYHKTTTVGTIAAPPFTPALSAPADAALLASGRVHFGWTGASGTSSYRLQVSENPLFTPALIDTTIKSASYDPGYDPGSDLASGKYFWRVMASDTLKNVSDWSSPWSVTVDAGAPVNTTADNFINGGAAMTGSTLVSLAISATKKTGVAAYYISERPEPPAAGRKDWKTIPVTASYAADIPYTLSKGEGEKKVYVWFKDALGRVSRGRSDSIVFDTTLPRTTITGHPAHPSRSTSASFAFISSKPKSTFRCRLDDGAYSSCTADPYYENLPAGPHTFAVQAIDAGNKPDPNPPSFTWTIDTTPPRTAITGQPPAWTNRTSAAFSFTSTKAESAFRCQLDGAPLADCTSPLDYTGLAAGSHTFTVAATDAAGNTDPAPPRYTWTIDGTPFGTTITSKPANPSKSTAATFSFESRKAGVTFRCQLDSGSYGTCRSPITYTRLSEEQHTFSVKAIDDSGNEDITPARCTWEIRIPPTNTTPQVFINRGGAYFAANELVKLTISATSEKGVTGYLVSESPLTPDASDSRWVIFPAKTEYSQTVEYTMSESAGNKRVYVWFKDEAGNVSDARSDTLYLFNAYYVVLISLIVQVIIIL